jgi:hypothetical protein
MTIKRTAIKYSWITINQLARNPPTIAEKKLILLGVIQGILTRVWARLIVIAPTKRSRKDLGTTVEETSVASLISVIIKMRCPLATQIILFSKWY